MIDAETPSISTVPDLLSYVIERLEKRKTPDSFRVFHGRGKCFPAFAWLSIDNFDNVLFLTVYRCLPTDLRELLSSFKDETLVRRLQSLNIDCVLVQHRYQSKSPVEAILGSLPESVFATRNGLQFGLSFGQQNAGFFLDIEPVRVWLEQACPGKSILNMFAYTCAFSAVAIQARAASVVNIDMSKKSITRGKENHRMNGLPADSVTFLSHDIFKSWGKLKKYGPYDIVIIDPPSFQSGSFIAQNDYVKVLNKMKDLVASDGFFVACLNAPEVHENEFKAWIGSSCEDFTLVNSLPAHRDFPEAERGKGLKMLVYGRN